MVISKAACLECIAERMSDSNKTASRDLPPPSLPPPLPPNSALFAQAGIEELKIKGRIRVACNPLIPRLPVIAAFKVLPPLKGEGQGKGGGMGGVAGGGWTWDQVLRGTGCC